MKTGLLFKDKTYQECELTFYEKDLICDLELEEIIKSASQTDPYLANVFTHVLMDKLTNKDEIKYRQDILKDAINNEVFFRDLYYFAALITNEIKREFRFGIKEERPSSVMWTSHSMLAYLADKCTVFRKLCEKQVKLESIGLKDFITHVLEDFSDERLLTLKQVVEGLDPDKGTMMTVTLDGNLRETSCILNRSTIYEKEDKRRWKKAERINFPVMTESLIQEINQKIDMAAYNISKDMGRITQAICDFFDCLRYELAFYVGALNLKKAIQKLEASYTFPEIVQENHISYTGLYDLALSLKMKSPAVSNSHQMNDKKLVIITGANQGGKTTYLRSYGQALLLAQAGIIVPAESLSLYPYSELYVHFDREEDSNMESGKFDDEIKRLSAIVSHMKRNSLLMLNESFQSTNEHEGSSIGTGIIRAFLDEGVHIILVTHMYELSTNLISLYKDDTTYLRAVRGEDGKRAFTLEEAEPLKTSFAMDLYEKIFEEKN